MIWFILLINLTLLLKTNSYIHPPTPNIQIQNHYLKDRILEEFRQKHNEEELDLNEDPRVKYANYEYISLDKNYRITPISENDERKFSHKYRLPQLRSSKKVERTTEANYLVSVPAASVGRTKKVKKRKPSEIYYRRSDFKSLSPLAGDYVHCHTHVTPLLMGVKKNLSGFEWGPIHITDRTVQRLIKIINLNTTDYKTEEILSVLYQISNLPMRFFLWSYRSITLLLDTIIKDPDHTLQKLKYGLKMMFYRWKLEITDTSELVKQTKIFRPPCIQISNIEASTLTASFRTYPTTSKLTTKLCFHDDNTEYPC